ncbi:MAG: hypothetical protein HY016_04425 [Nitrosomonadales bacterium]|nr:hypothetical protein [Nitrosomonadales bacterium]
MKIEPSATHCEVLLHPGKLGASQAPQHLPFIAEAAVNFSSYSREKAADKTTTLCAART